MTKSKLIPPTWEIPDYFHRRLGDQPGRQRAMCESNHLLLVIHEPPAANERKRGHRIIYRGPDGNWLSSGRGTGLSDLKNVLDTYAQQFVQLEKLSDSAKTADDFMSLNESIIPLRRSARNFYQTLQDARESMPDVRELINLRDQAYELSRTGELLTEEIESAMNLTRMRRAEEQSLSAHMMSKQGHRLNLLAGFFLPLVTLATVFSISPGLGFVQTLTNPTVQTVAGIGIAIGAIVCWVIMAFRK